MKLRDIPLNAGEDVIAVALEAESEEMRKEGRTQAEIVAHCKARLEGLIQRAKGGSNAR